MANEKTVTQNVLDDELLEALASGREDLVDAATLARVAEDPTLREEIARARALSLDVGLLLDDAHPPVNVGALVQRAIQNAPPVVEARHLKLAGIVALVSTVGFGLLSLPRLPGWDDLARAAQLAGSFVSLATSAMGRLPVGAGFAAACVCIALVLLLGRRSRAARGAISVVFLATSLGAPSYSGAQDFHGEWPATERVSVDAENESRSAVLREVAEDSNLNIVSHLQTDPLITVRVSDVPLRAFLSVALAGEPDASVSRQDGMIVVLPAGSARPEAAPDAPVAPVAPAAPIAPVAPVAPQPPLPPLPPGSVDDRFSMGDNIQLSTGETVRDLVTLGGNAVVDGTVLGDCFSMGGNIEVRGVVHGDLMSMGGNIHIFPGARVLGEVGSMGGEITNDSGVFIRNQQSVETEEAEPPARNFFRRASRHGVIFLLGLILLGAFQPRHALLCQAVIRSPLRAAMSGAGGFFAALILTLALAVTLIGIPLSVLVVLLTTVSVYFGFAVVASVLGALLPVPKWQGHPLKQLAAGVAILFVLSSIPVVSVFADVFAACIGFGAVVLTRFGRPSTDTI
ncbi:MAG: hypothetical protein AB8H86_28575 [Polyangiales bacterium]